MKKHRLGWFVKRIGHKIKGNGYEVLVVDIKHAKYLFLAQDEMGNRYE